MSIVSLHSCVHIYVCVYHRREAQIGSTIYPCRSCSSNATRGLLRARAKLFTWILRFFLRCFRCFPSNYPGSRMDRKREKEKESGASCAAPHSLKRLLRMYNIASAAKQSAGEIGMAWEVRFVDVSRHLATPRAMPVCFSCWGGSRVATPYAGCSWFATDLDIAWSCRWRGRSNLCLLAPVAAAAVAGRCLAPAVSSAVWLWLRNTLAAIWMIYVNGRDAL